MIISGLGLEVLDFRGGSTVLPVAEKVLWLIVSDRSRKRAKPASQCTNGARFRAQGLKFRVRVWVS